MTVAVSGSRTSRFLSLYIDRNAEVGFADDFDEVDHEWDI